MIFRTITRWASLFFMAGTLLSFLQAQPYNGAIGGRLGFPAGLSYKQFLSNKWALEAIGGIYLGKGFNLTGLAEGHAEVFNENVLFMYGLGGHIGSYDEKLDVGPDGIIGLEFILNAPISIGFDYKPALTIPSFKFINGGGLTFRYIW